MDGCCLVCWIGRNSDGDKSFVLAQVDGCLSTYTTLVQKKQSNCFVREELFHAQRIINPKVFLLLINRPLGVYFPFVVVGQTLS